MKLGERERKRGRGRDWDRGVIELSVLGVFLSYILFVEWRKK